MNTTASWLEIVGMVANAIGIIANYRLIRRMRARRMAALANGAQDGDENITTADRYIRNESARFYLHIVGVLGCIGLMFLPGDIPMDYWFVSVLSIGTTATTAYLVVSAVRDLLDDDSITRMFQGKDIAP